MTLRLRRCGRCMRAVLLALFAFAIFGPLLNLFLWAFAEKLVLPEQAAARIRPDLLVPGIPAARQRAGLARHQHMDRGADGRREPRRRDAGRLCAGAAEAAVAQRDPARCSCCRRRCPTCRSTSTSRKCSTDRPQRHDTRRRARACVARPGARSLDRLGRVRLGRRFARRGGAQPRGVALDMLSHRDASARGARV